MYPELVRIGPFTVYSYGVMVATGIFAASVAVSYLAARRGIPASSLLDVVFWAVLAGLVGARLTYVLLYLDEFRASWISVIKVQEGGLVFQGGLLAGIAAAAICVRRYKLAAWESFDLLSVGLPLAHAFGRVGCFLNGCCYGRPSTGIFAVRFPGHLRYVHPTMLYEAIAVAMLFALLWRTERRKRFPGQVVALYLCGYGIIRFFMEFLRGDPRPLVGPLSLFQLISLGIMAAGIGLYCQRRHQHA